MKPRITRWEGCYDSTLKDLITPESFVHPAKMARLLTERIFDYGREQGWWKPGDHILDPFGGIGTTAVIGVRRGYNVTLVELESHFFDLAAGCDCTGLSRREYVTCFGRWKRLNGETFHLCPRCAEEVGRVDESGMRSFFKDLIYYRNSGRIPHSFPHHYTGNIEMANAAARFVGISAQGRVLRGDSRRLIQLLQEGVGGCVSSPPYGGIRDQGGDGSLKKYGIGLTRGERFFGPYGNSEGQIGQMPVGTVSSPPYVSGGHHRDVFDAWNVNSRGQRISRENAGYGDSEGQIGQMPVGTISSPPYSDTRVGMHSGAERVGHLVNYGETEGQLGNFPTGALTSPTYGTIAAGAGGLNTRNGNGSQQDGRSPDSPSQRADTHYGETEGQTANMPAGSVELPDTYWGSVFSIYRQLYALLPPGGTVALVVKDFARDNERVPLCDQTVEVLGQAGFEIVERTHAMLVSETVQPTLWGGVAVQRKERKSFFKRLHEKHGGPAIDYEEVLWGRK